MHAELHDTLQRCCAEHQKWVLLHITYTQWYCVHTMGEKCLELCKMHGVDAAGGELTKTVVGLVYLRVQVPAVFSRVTSGFTHVKDLVSLSIKQ